MTIILWRKSLIIRIVSLVILFVCLIGFFYNTHNVSSFSIASLSVAQYLNPNHSNITSSNKPSATFHNDHKDTDRFFFFNHFHPVKFIDQLPIPSSVHCVGQSNDPSPSDFIYRSCWFQNLCVNTHGTNGQPEFIIISDSKNKKWTSITARNQLNDTIAISSSTMDWNNATVALGPIAAAWSLSDRKRVEWFPRVVDKQQFEQYGGYYQLNPDVILIPFEWHGAGNPGHVVWDAFLPIYKLLNMFGLWNDSLNGNHANDGNSSSSLLLINMPMEDYLFSACTRAVERLDCEKTMQKLLPLMRLSSHDFMTDFNVDHAKLLKAVTPSDTLASDLLEVNQSTLICARQGVAGLGMLSDHGTKEHGQYLSDYTTIHNVGKSELVFSFRNMVLRNMGVTTPSTLPLHEPYRIILSVNSTKDSSRMMFFEPQRQAMEAAFDKKQVSIESVVMRDLSLVDQLRLVSQSFVYISACGGSVFSATFLPRGATLILYFARVRNRRPNMLDYDLLNNLAYIHVHWLPTKYMNDQIDLELLVSLIQSELDHVMTMRQEEEAANVILPT